MFDNLKKAFSNVSTGFSEKDLNEKDIEDVLFELEINLLESDVATEVIDSIKDSLKEKIIGSRVEKKNIQNFVKQSLIEFISETFDNAGHVDLVARINEKKSLNEPFIVVFVGINGTGKTTSLAKIANILKNEKLSVVIAAADTYRAGAIEQLREHTKRLNLKIIAQNYGSDPAAVAKDAVLYAKSHNVDCVLVDTAGRMQTSSNLMEQIAKITKVVNPDMKIFVGDSLAGNDTVNQAREFHNQVKFDCSILTKSDADARGGAALSIVKVTSSPIIYVGVGQEYDDIVKFNKKTFLENVFESTDIDVQSLSEIKKSEPQPEPEPQTRTRTRTRTRTTTRTRTRTRTRTTTRTRTRTTNRTRTRTTNRTRTRTTTRTTTRTRTRTRTRTTNRTRTRTTNRTRTRTRTTNRTRTTTRTRTTNRTRTRTTNRTRTRTRTRTTTTRK